ncbi:photosynthetic protein synthase I [Leptospira tipperaryensis]|uniref:Photosynthetic protein synthase I n=1 Tax=Leptospira tipperaryensis TaxID=2564040 RepID=A0A1D7UVM6_9LEPT|nr:SCO family protein [Leptospira tipperaryensis]AOP33657.1 photosynthetic protein synthase I [Leptospira tipperaryensis]
MKEKILFILVLVLGIGIGFFGWKEWKNASKDAPVFVEEWSKTSLIDTKNQEVLLSDIPGKLKLVYFGFSHCPDMCPRALLDMSTAVKELGNDAKDLTPIFISVDPERDSPELLAKYVKQFPSERLVALTGEKNTLDVLQSAFGAVSKKVSNPSIEGGYTVDHTIFLYIVDEKSQILATFPGGMDGKLIAKEIRRFL